VPLGMLPVIIPRGVVDRGILHAMSASRDGLPPSLTWLAPGPVRTGRLSDDVRRFLAQHGCEPTAVHSGAVADVAGRLAERFNAQVAAARTASWLHDISAVIPNAARIQAAVALGVEVLDAEMLAPMILHQKLSAALADQLFDVHDAAVLEAIRTHTTLHPCAGLLAKIVFVADKLAWDQPGRPPYEGEMLAALDRSLDAAACVYLDTLWAQRAELAVVHPWFVAARQRFCEVAGGQ
jgi:HD superfamily phosphohydrolase YqeK